MGGSGNPNTAETPFLPFPRGEVAELALSLSSLSHILTLPVRVSGHGAGQSVPVLTACSTLSPSEVQPCLSEGLENPTAISGADANATEECQAPTPARGAPDHPGSWK